MRLVGAVGIEPTTFGLKGRCSTTELRPYMRLNILHGNKFLDLGGIGARGGIFWRRHERGQPARDDSRRRGSGRGTDSSAELVASADLVARQNPRESRQACDCDNPRLGPSRPK